MMRRQVIEAEIRASFHVGAARLRDIYSLEQVQNAWTQLKQHLLNVKLDEEDAKVAEIAKEAALETIKGELLWRALKNLIEDDEEVARQLVKEIKKNLAD